LDCSGFFVLKK